MSVVPLTITPTNAESLVLDCASVGTLALFLVTRDVKDIL